MDKEKKIKLEELKRRAQVNKLKHELENKELFQECLGVLKSYSIVDNEDEIKRIERLISTTDAEMHKHNDPVLLEEEAQYYIVWDEATLPIILSFGKKINEFWEDVMAVAFDTYFVSETSEKVIGIRH